MERSGGALALQRLMRRWVKQGPGRLELATVALSSCVAFDGYISVLTVGSVMRPLYTYFNASRLKLAYLIRTLSVPLCAINPLAICWIAPQLVQLEISGVGSGAEHALVQVDPFTLYFKMIPYAFFPYLTLITALAVTMMGVSFGWMRQLEQENKGELEPSEEEEIEEKNHKNFVFDFFLPVICLLIGSSFFILYLGGYRYLGGSHGFMETIEQGKVSLGLLCGLGVTLIFYFPYLIFRQKIRLKEIGWVIWRGIKMMLPSVLIFNLAWTMGSIEIGNHTLSQSMHHLLPRGYYAEAMLPLLFFIISAGVSTAIGSSWATLALLFPVAVGTAVSWTALPPPLSSDQIPLLLPLLGAVLSGAVCGDALSPLSDASALVATIARCQQVDHIWSQMTFALPLVAGTLYAYLFFGLLSVNIPMAILFFAIIGLASLWIILYLRYQQRQEIKLENGVNYGKG